MGVESDSGAGVIQRSEAREAFGSDAAGYEAGRPDYPPRVYRRLVEQYGLGPGKRVLEIGPGAGLATRHLVEAGASVTAVEPDLVLAAHLHSRLPQVGIIEAAFEDVELADASFDLVVAAMSFHWVDQSVGLPKLAKILVPGGWAALWWTLWGDPARPDDFGQAAAALLGQSASAANEPGRPQYELDAQARLADLRHRAQLEQVSHEAIPWTIEMDAVQVRAHCASMIAIRRRAPDEQQRLLDALAALVTDRFGGRVQRNFLTVLYAGRRPHRLEP